MASKYDGYSAADLSRAADLLESEGKIAQAEELRSEAERRDVDFGDVARSAAQGATFGLADEIEAGARAAFSERDYLDIRDEIRAENQMFREYNPELDFMLQLAGGLAVPGLGSAKLLQQGLKTASPLGRAAMLAGTGAAEGALAGYGTAEESPERGALVGAMAGGVLAPALGLGVPAAANVGRRAWERLTRTPAQAADELMGSAVRAAGGADEVFAAQEALGPAGMLMDVDEPLRVLGARAAVRSDEALGDLSGVLAARQRGAPERVQGVLTEGTGIERGAYQTYEDVLGGAKERLGARLYEESGLRDAPVQMTEEMGALLDTKIMKPFVREAQDSWELRTGTTPNPEQPLPLEFYQRIKFGLDEAIEKAQAQLKPGAPASRSARARDLGRAKDRLLVELGEQVPEFGAANLQYGQVLGVQKAGRLGRSLQKAGSEKLDEIERQVVEMTPAEQAAFRMGAREDIGEAVAEGRRRTGSLASRVIGDEPRERRLALAARSDAEAAEMISRLEAEEAFTETSKMIRPTMGSRTAFLQSEVQESGLAGAILKEFGDAMTEETATRTAKMLMSRMTREELRTLELTGELPRRLIPTIQQVARAQAITPALLTATGNVLQD